MSDSCLFLVPLPSNSVPLVRQYLPCCPCEPLHLPLCIFDSPLSSSSRSASSSAPSATARPFRPYLHNVAHLRLLQGHFLFVLTNLYVVSATMLNLRYASFAVVLPGPRVLILSFLYTLIIAVSSFVSTIGHFREFAVHVVYSRCGCFTAYRLTV